MPKDFVTVHGPPRWFERHNPGVRASVKLMADVTLEWTTATVLDPLTPPLRFMAQPNNLPVFDLTVGLWLAVAWAGCSQSQGPIVIPAQVDDDAIDALVSSSLNTAAQWAIVGRISMQGILYHQQ